MGFIGIDPCDLKQWQLSRRQLADFLVRNLSLTPTGVSVDAPVIALGWKTSNMAGGMSACNLKAPPNYRSTMGPCLLTNLFSGTDRPLKSTMRFSA